MKQLYPNIQIVGGEADKVPGETLGVQDKQVIEINGLKITCFHTPCHTKGHISFYVAPAAGEQEGLAHTIEHQAGYQVTKSVNRAVFTGDTIFIGGAGRFFEGKPEQMCYAMQLARDVWPADTKMFVGHEYTVANMKFCATVDGKNQDVLAMLEKVSKQRAEGFWTVPTLLSEEKKFNVFMRSFDQDIQKICGTTDPTSTMGFLREWKNSGKRPSL